MENTIENKIIFLESQLRSYCIGDFTQYFGATVVPVHFKDLKEITCRLVGIYNTSGQQFLMEFNVPKVERLEFINCFGEHRWNYEHTCHAENLTVLKHSFSSITNQDASRIGRSVGLANAKVVERDNECVMVVDDSYSIGLFATGVITMYKGFGLNLKPYWQDLNKLYTAANALGYYVGDGKEIKYGWVKIIDHETIQAK